MGWLGDLVDDVLEIPEKVVEKTAELPAKVVEKTEDGFDNLMRKITGEDS